MIKITKVIVKNCQVNYSEMQSQAISELQFPKFSGGACPDPPRKLKKFFSPLCVDQIFFRFNKTRLNFGIDPCLMHCRSRASKDSCCQKSVTFQIQISVEP